MTFSLCQAGHVFSHVHSWLVWMIGLSVGLHKKLLSFMQSGRFLCSNTFTIQNIPLKHKNHRTSDLPRPQDADPDKNNKVILAKQLFCGLRAARVPLHVLHILCCSWCGKSVEQPIINPEFVSSQWSQAKRRKCSSGILFTQKGDIFHLQKCAWIVVTDSRRHVNGTPSSRSILRFFFPSCWQWMDNCNHLDCLVHVKFCRVRCAGGGGEGKHNMFLPWKSRNVWRVPSQHQCTCCETLM